MGVNLHESDLYDLKAYTDASDIGFGGFVVPAIDSNSAESVCDSSDVQMNSSLITPRNSLHTQQKQNVTDLQSAIKQAKGKYAKSLRKLEDISLAIHESRRNKLLLMYSRQPGVGIDCDSLHSNISELTLASIGKDYEMVDFISNENDGICDESDCVEDKCDDGGTHSSNKTDDEKDIDLTNTSNIFENLQIADDKF
ncbi:unnamed protein product [Mytilus edulis]|uniref:Uncharacterized protein n=1 Tax=Mytilus edulis TaxID=6550 RepID=A0A8S3QHS9_MYTED|nr:unnamed protein product [Mytilus edulis]